MANVKIILRKEPRKGGYPLAIRITKDRKTSYVYLDYRLNPSDWDEANQRVKKSHPYAARLNNYIIKKLAEANNSALELETAKTVVSAKAVSQKIKPKTGANVFAQADLYIQRLKEDGKYNIWNCEKSRVKHLKEFLGSDVGFQDLTIPVLERFKAYLISKMEIPLILTT